MKTAITSLDVENDGDCLILELHKQSEASKQLILSPTILSQQTGEAGCLFTHLADREWS